MGSVAVRLLYAVALLVAGCVPPIPPSPRDSLGPPLQALHGAEIRFAAIGDYGEAGPPARDVADVVIGWKPDLVVTTGDNNYPRGAAATIDGNVGRYYHRFLLPYTGRFGPGADRNRFFPALGNHDLHADGGRTHRAYFNLPGNERYYDFIAGPVRFFALSSDPREPDGVAPDSVQGRWLRRRLAASRARWNVVYFHHPPYSSGRRDDAGRWMRWPFATWGADVVLAGHEHLYERLEVDGIPYVVVGLGGGRIYEFDATPRAESQRRFNGDHGALLGVATATHLSFRFVTRTQAVVDTLSLPANGPQRGRHSEGSASLTHGSPFQ